VTAILPAFEKLNSEVQSRILDVAARAFAEEGYHHASISDICSAAGISNGALYKYFKNKQDLFYAVLDCTTKPLEELYQKNFRSGLPLFEAIESFLFDLASFENRHHDYSGIYCDLGSSSMNRFATVAAEKFRNATSLYIIRKVRESRLHGEIEPGVDSGVAAYMIDSYITIFSYSIVSEYQKNRFNSFFAGDLAGENGPVDTVGMIRLTIRSLRQALSKR
jgi:AcrR family transcriptional regulator